MTRRQAIKFTGALLASAPGVLAGPATATLTIQMNEAGGGKGTVRLGLFNETSDFPMGKPFRGVNVEMTGGKATAVFKDLEPGTYAATAYLDKNNNGKIDKNLLGKPTEPYGFSNNARGMFGPPKFEEARFQLIAGETAISFDLK